jgi:ATP-dependent DNA helicase DinG
MAASPEIRLPRLPVAVAGMRHVAWLDPDGEIETLSREQAGRRLTQGARPIVCHAAATARRLGITGFPALDILELYAFVRPARFALPTPRGLAESLGLALPVTPEAETTALLGGARALLAELAAGAGRDQIETRRTVGQAEAMARGGWGWAPSVLAALGRPEGPASAAAVDSLRVWNRLPEWQDQGVTTQPTNFAVETGEATERLTELLGSGAEDRPGQRAYVATCTAAFRPRNRKGEPNLVLAEAGTGVGKTLGYVAPASLWAEANEGAVWISTYTRNLQRQLDGELDRLCPTPAEKERRVVIRKGRENYLCLLNLAEAVGRIGADDAVALGLVARWAAATRDGDMMGGDFPAWLVELLGHRLTLGLTDTRGECIYAACDHYRKCFIERTQRRARHADLVIANHALVMVQAALGGGIGAADDGQLPTRYVFDEGHQLFDAADNAFAAHLSGRETAELRRWLIGAEEGSRRRARGLKARAGELIEGDERAEELMDETLRAARVLPASGWPQRLVGDNPIGLAENFLALVRQQVYARDAGADGPFDLETGTRPPVDGLLDAAAALADALLTLSKPLEGLMKGLAARLDAEADELDSATRARIEGLQRSITRRALLPLVAWRDMLASLAAETPSEFVDWFAIERIAGRDADVGYRRHWLDPTRPLAEAVFEPAHGVLVTSATLRDQTAGAEDSGWAGAEARTGAKHIPLELTEAAHASPFDYARNTQVLVVGDVGRNDVQQIAAAYRELFIAAGGGALGLFTAIQRLRAVHERIAGPLEDAGLPLLAQHVDAMDTGTLIDIFRAEEDACLLGTDAVRDGVDVPGRSLRLIAFDRVPWPRPTLIHKARKQAFGGGEYDTMLARLRLKQAYGRLLRRAGDKGVFVLLDRAMPSRLKTAFPEGVEPVRLGLAEAVARIRAFLQANAG